MNELSRRGNTFFDFVVKNIYLIYSQKKRSQHRLRFLHNGK